MIATAIQRASTIYVYNEKNALIRTLPGTLHGFTGTTVSVKRANTIYVYDEKGKLISSHRG